MLVWDVYSDNRIDREKKVKETEDKLSVIPDVMTK